QIGHLAALAAEGPPRRVHRLVPAVDAQRAVVSAQTFLSELTGGLRPPDPLTRVRLRAKRAPARPRRSLGRRRALAGAPCPAPCAWLARFARSRLRCDRAGSGEH